MGAVAKVSTLKEMTAPFATQARITIRLQEVLWLLGLLIMKFRFF